MKKNFILFILLNACSSEVLHSKKEFFKDGKIKCEYFRNEKGQLEGEYKTWHKSGQLSSITKYDEGEKNGRFILYWENGKKSIEEFYITGKLDGFSVTYDLSGDTIKISKYKQGKLLFSKLKNEKYN